MLTKKKSHFDKNYKEFLFWIAKGSVLGRTCLLWNVMKILF